MTKQVATRSVESMIIAADGRPSGFDYMRLCLALSIVAWHTVAVSYGHAFEQTVWQTPWRMLIGLILPMFFALSGFLVAGSLERSKTLVTFVGLRAFRIAPALAGDVLLSALILGPLTTEFSLQEYFSSPELFSYFRNIFGDIHFSLPGVFLNNPIPNTVNGQLWTIPYELKCYIALTLLAGMRLFRNSRMMLLIVVLLYIFELAHFFLKPDLSLDSPMGGNTLVVTFITGVVAYKYRQVIPHSFWLFVVSLASAMMLFLMPGGDRFAAIPVVYVTLYLGVMNPPRQKTLLSGDYSYGIYLYGVPIQQAIAWLGPSFQTWYWSLASLPVTAAIAVLSWRYIEKPVLDQRPILKQLENWVYNLPLQFSRKTS